VLQTRRGEMACLGPHLRFLPPLVSLVPPPTGSPLFSRPVDTPSNHTSRFSINWAFCATSRRCWFTLFRRISHVETEMVMNETTIHAIRIPSSRPISFFVLKMICG